MNVAGKEYFSRLAALFTLLPLALLLAPTARAQQIHSYVGRIGTTSFLLAWGTLGEDGNTIGRNSTSVGDAVVEVDGRRLSSRRNWIEVTGLRPDRPYPYRLLIDGREAASGSVRTHPVRATRLSFFVIGDFGTGSRGQRRIAEAMWEEFQKRENTDSPIRFILTAGDNIYADTFIGILARNSGDEDKDWRRKFFEPYAPLLRHIPFYPVPGNHDRGGPGGEREQDYHVYLDNFFFPTFPTDEPRGYYSFSFGSLADFFALDSTAVDGYGPLRDSLSPGGGQFQWLRETLAESQAPWKIAYLHHPPFTAGPRHEPSMDSLAHVVKLFAGVGVDVAFSGHEHNFQYANRTPQTGRTLYVVSGAGGRLRGSSIWWNLENAGITGTANNRHFLAVDIAGDTMRITPLSDEPVEVRGPGGELLPVPITITHPTASARTTP